eukprot:g1536.t1
MANAKANTTVGLVGLLGVLVDLLNNLNTSLESMPQMDKMIPVDLSEMAEFIAVVQNRFVFLTCVSRCQLQFVGQNPVSKCEQMHAVSVERVYLKMTGSNWGRTTDPDSDMTSLAYTLQDILQKQEVLEETWLAPRKAVEHRRPWWTRTPLGSTDDFTPASVGDFVVRFNVQSLGWGDSGQQHEFVHIAGSPASGFLRKSSESLSLAAVDFRGPRLRAVLSMGDDTKIHRRITWLNGNVFPDRPIDPEAIEAVKRLGVSRGFELLKDGEQQLRSGGGPVWLRSGLEDAEEKSGKITNPSGYLKAAVLREGVVAPSLMAPIAPVQAEGKGNAHDEGKVHRRASWLNANVFPDRPIDEEAIAMLKALGAARNPSGYLKTAVAREPTGPPSPMRSQPAALGPEEKIYRRGSWLNAKVFADRPIDDEALEAVKSLGIQRAMELFKAWPCFVSWPFCSCAIITMPSCSPSRRL